MDKLYTLIKKTLGDNIPELSHIDEDTGQLEAMLNGEDTYPITFPAALVAFNDIAWSDVKVPDFQNGKGVLSIRLAFDCYSDTHYGAPEDDTALTRMEILKNVSGLVRGIHSPTTGRQLVRTATRTYSLPGRIKVYETDYQYSIEETFD